MKTCLVVDDSRVIRTVSRHLVEALGFRVSEAPDGAEALRLFDERRGQFAHTALNSNQILKDIKVERSESFRFKGQDWHEIVAKAVEVESGQPIIVMQTIRFEPDRYVRMVGLSRVEQRDRNLPRFRNVIDGIDLSP